MRKIKLLIVLILCISSMTYATVKKNVNNEVAGSLLTLFTSEEFSSITELTVTGTIDARDIKTMRDSMPILEILDFSGANIIYYAGEDGTQDQFTVYGSNTIPEWAFNDCYNLISLSIPASVDTIGYCAVNNCFNLETFTIPDSSKLKVIADYAFEYCESLKSIFIPNTIKSIGSGAFSDCLNLVSVEIPSSVISIGVWAFTNCSALITVDGANQKFSSNNDILYDKQKLILIQCPISKTGIIDIPASVEIIGPAAFNKCFEITSVVLPLHLKTISNEAFYECTGITTITIPDSVTSIGVNAFAYCTNLTTLNFNAKNCLSIGNKNSPAFVGCTSDCTLNISKNVREIPPYAFSYFSGLKVINTLHSIPLKISNSNQFNNMDKNTCILNVPTYSKQYYVTSPGWMEFTNIKENIITDINQIDNEGLTLILQNGRLVFNKTVENLPVFVYDINGEVLFRGVANGNELETHVLGSGLYFVKVGGEKFKIIQK